MSLHCTHCSMPKGTCWAEVTSNSEKIKPIAIAINKLCLSEGISQLGGHSGSQLCNQSVETSFKKMKSVSVHTEGIFGVGYT